VEGIHLSFGIELHPEEARAEGNVFPRELGVLGLDGPNLVPFPSPQLVGHQRVIPELSSGGRGDETPFPQREAHGLGLQGEGGRCRTGRKGKENEEKKAQ